MTIVHGYCTTADVAARVGDEQDPRALEAAITAASRAIDQHCRRRFWCDAAASARVYHPVPCNARLWVDDISSTSGLIVKTDDNADGSFETTWSAGDYRLEPPNQVSADGIEGYPYVSLVALQRPWPIQQWRPDCVQITAKWGWSAVPAAVEGVCVELAARNVVTPLGVRSEMIGGYQVTYLQSSTGEALTPFALTEADACTLAPFVKTWA